MNRRGDAISPIPSIQPALIPQETIDQAARLLLDAAPAGSEVILFGSYARGDANADSDLDFMVVEPDVTDARAESVRLRRAAAGVRAPMDVLVVSRQRFERWRTFVSTAAAEAHREGKVYRRGA